MKAFLNTLYVTTPGAYLSQDGETVLVRIEKEVRLRVPLHTLSAIVCFGAVGCSPPLMGHCATRGVALAFLAEHGRFLARVQGGVSGNVLLRREQYRRADDVAGAVESARTMVAAKVANSRGILVRAARDRPSAREELETAAKDLARVLRRLDGEKDLDVVRGREGEAARTYFEVFDHLIVSQKKDFFFRGRNRRPPKDNMNALLSFLYTLLTSDTVGACEGVGLDPAVGCLHRDRPGRPGLALDLVEELRAGIADRLALALVNRKQIQGRGFTTRETGEVMMSDDTRKKVLVAYQERKREEIDHPYLGEKIPIGLLPHVQTLLYARFLRGDLDAYPAFVWR